MLTSFTADPMARTKLRGGFNADEPLTKGVKLEIETGKSLKESKDRLEKGEKEGSRPFKKLNITPDERDKTWKKMREAVEREKGAGHIYGPNKTSNSVVRTALEASGQKLDDALPKGVSKNELIGIERNLSVPSKPSQQRGPNPIKGEIGGTEDQKPAPTYPADPSDSNDDGKPQSHDISAGTDAGDDDLENASPENRTFMDDVLKPLKPVDEIMLKRPEDLTKGEFIELKKAMIDLPAGPEQDRLDKAATRFLENRFGTKPVKTDAVGRLVEPRPVRDIPETPKPVANAGGKPLKYDLRRIGRNILKDAKSDGLAAAVKRLQGGINILDQTPKLKEDGVFGRKSRAGFRDAVARLGAPKVEEGLALGRFNAFARDGQKQGFGGLAGATEKSFAPLFRTPAKPPSTPAQHIETVTLQETLNDLGRTQFGGNGFEALKLDGDIGPLTTETFGRLSNALGPERVTKRFGEFLGFF